MKTLATSALLLSTLLVAACGGSESSNNNTVIPCAVTVSGTSAGSGTCQVAGSHVSGQSGSAITATGLSMTGDLSGVTFSILVAGNALTDKTYGPADVQGAAELTISNKAGALFMASTDTSTSPPTNTGTWSVHFTDVGTGSNASGNTVWLHPHGTIDATLPAESSGSGSLTVHVTF